MKRPDPILFFDNVILYEDELADNGISMLSCKIRVMPGRLLALTRFFLRLDDVLFRIRDTRVYVDFETKEVIREYVAREQDFESVKSVCAERDPPTDLIYGTMYSDEASLQKLANKSHDMTAVMRDQNVLSEILPVVERTVENVFLP